MILVEAFGESNLGPDQLDQRGGRGIVLAAEHVIRDEAVKEEVDDELPSDGNEAGSWVPE